MHSADFFPLPLNPRETQATDTSRPRHTILSLILHFDSSELLHDADMKYIV